MAFYDGNVGNYVCKHNGDNLSFTEGIDEFRKKANVRYVNENEFISIISDRRKDGNTDSIRRGTAYQYQENGKVQILIKLGTKIPEKYVHYVLEHELYESYGADILMNLAKKEFTQIFNNILENNADSIFNFCINEYAFDYKHEYAILQEYTLAFNEGNLVDYHKIIMGMRDEDLSRYNDPTVIRKTENDIRIREMVYEKLLRENTMIICI